MMVILNLTDCNLDGLQAIGCWDISDSGTGDDLPLHGQSALNERHSAVRLLAAIWLLWHTVASLHALHTTITLSCVGSTFVGEGLLGRLDWSLTWLGCLLLLGLLAILLYRWKIGS